MQRLARRTSSVVLVLCFVVLWIGPSGAEASTSGSQQAKMCNVPKSQPIRVTVRSGERKAVQFDRNCRSSVVTDTAPAPTPPSAQTSSAASASPLVAGSLTCHAKSNVTDPVNAVLTEGELYFPWSFDGSNVTGVGGGWTTARWLQDGWHPTDGPSWFLYQGSLPTWQRDAEGWVDFEWIDGTYWHEHRAIQHVDGGGGCYADFLFAGEIPAQGGVHYYVFKD
jgi:hypothetical protein